MTDPTPELSPKAIVAPPARRKLEALHNLYSVPEVIEALTHMKVGSRERLSGETEDWVVVTWRNGGQRSTNYLRTISHPPRRRRQDTRRQALDQH